MKTNHKLTLLIYVLLIIASGIQFSCSATGNSSTNKQKPERTYTTLLDMLWEQPQLNISGSGSRASINIRGNKSILYDDEPLFVVDDNPVGFGYSSASWIDVNSVESVSVLVGAEASMYGARGANGVIVIDLK